MKIVKQKPLIMGKMDQFTCKHLDFINTLYALMQHKLGDLDFNNVNTASEQWHSFEATTLKNLSKVKKNDYIYELEKLSQMLRDHSIVIKNLKDPQDGTRKLKVYSTSLILEFKIYKNVTNYKTLFSFKFSEVFILMASRNYSITKGFGNYTPIDISIVSTIKSKRSKRLYELLKGQDNPDYPIVITLKELQTLFAQKNHFHSETHRILKSCNKYLHHMLPFEYHLNYEKGSIKFYRLDLEVQSA